MESSSSSLPAVARAQVPLRRPRRAVGSAALLALVCLLVGGLLWKVRRDLRPPPTAVVVAVQPAGVHVPYERQRAVVRPPEGRRVVLRLDLVDPGRPGSYAAEVYPPGSEVPAGTARVVSWGDAVHLDLGPGLRRGPYRIELYDGAEDGRRRVATYRLRIGEPEPGP